MNTYFATGKTIIAMVVSLMRSPIAHNGELLSAAAALAVLLLNKDAFYKLSLAS